MNCCGFGSLKAYREANSYYFLLQNAMEDHRVGDEREEGPAGCDGNRLREKSMLSVCVGVHGASNGCGVASPVTHGGPGPVSHVCTRCCISINISGNTAVPGTQHLVTCTYGSCYTIGYLYMVTCTYGSYTILYLW